MDGVGDILFSIITLNFVHTVFCLLPFLRCTSNFLALFSSAMCTLFFSSCFLSSRFNFLPSVFFLNEIFQVVTPSLVIHKFTLCLSRLTSINLENRLFAHNCPSARKFRSISIVYNYLKTS